MQALKGYLKIILGCLLIAISLNLFFCGDFVPAGIFGIVKLYHIKTNLDIWLLTLIANVIFLFLGVIGLPKKKIKKSLLAFALIPLLCWITKDISRLIDISNVDSLLVVLYGGAIMGLGARLIYKENRYISGSDIISSIEQIVFRSKKNIINYVIDIAVLQITFITVGFEQAMYSLIAVIIIEFLSKRASIGTSEAKVFYIITKKEKEVKSYIIDELQYTLTVFDVKGGFLKTKNTVLMTVIPTKDYYKLREGIKVIDKEAFISITDSYEVINGSKNRNMLNY